MRNSPDILPLIDPDVRADVEGISVLVLCNTAGVAHGHDAVGIDDSVRLSIEPVKSWTREKLFDKGDGPSALENVAPPQRSWFRI